ncbi:inosine-uridine preferring nucleoside hydrolase-domain-containing protein [Aspergillus keveii]|uniref:Inosine-uridine preferring nucleoside hydrolase-domain-containing protein n=1 Tax=Aspergillus keveii TaxID=714993 RepID=A0ABR4FWR3_9EURO
MRPLPSLATLLGLFEYTRCAPSGKNIIIDTDFYSDVDDAGALLLAFTHPDANLLGVNVNYPSTYSALAVSALLGYYNHSDVPLGLIRPYTNITWLDDFAYENGEYASKVAYHWRDFSPLPWGDVRGTWEPVKLYRKLLAGQSDGTVTIVGIGFFDNLSALLSSQPDPYSPLTGSELILSKVAELVIMGGSYPSGREYNFFGYNASAAAHVVNHWPGSITFLGDQVGKYVLSGGRLALGGPERDPVRAAYTWYNGKRRWRPSWDPLTMLYAIEGLGAVFRVGSNGGHNYVYPDGRNVWRSGDDGRSQRYLELALPNETAGAILDDKFLLGAIGATGMYFESPGYYGQDVLGFL